MVARQLHRGFRRLGPRIPEVHPMRPAPGRDGRELLFNNRTDPYQLRNLAEDRSQSATLGHFREMSRRWRKERYDTFEACTWYRDHWTEDRNIVMTATGTRQDTGALNKITAEWFKNGVGERAQ